MGLLNFFKKNKTNTTKMNYAITSSGRYPSNISYPDVLTVKDIIMLSIRCKANEFKKLNPRHIRNRNGKQEVISSSSVAGILARPNSYMTQSDFLGCITTLLELNKNVYIYPEYYIANSGEKVFTAMYPLRPRNVEILQDDSGTLFYQMTFDNGYKTLLRSDSIIHWRKDYGIDEYFGGNGYADIAGLKRAVSSYDTLLKSISKALDVSCNVNGIVKINSLYSDEKQKAEEQAFKEKLERNESGVLITDLKTEYVPMNRDVKLVDTDTVKFLYNNILRFNGTPLSILNGDYTKAQKESYYEHSLEADIKSLGEAMSRVFFTDRETGFGNSVILYPNSIVFMSMENKLSALSAGLPAGVFTINEARELLGYAPVEGGDVRPRGYNSLDNNQNDNNNNKNDNNNNKNDNNNNGDEPEVNGDGENNPVNADD